MICSWFFSKKKYESCPWVQINVHLSPNRARASHRLSPSIMASTAPNVCSRLTWSWMGSLMRLGASRPLLVDDLADLHPEFHADLVLSKFETAWAEEQTANPDSPSLVSVFKALHGHTYAKALCCIVFFDLCLFANPLLMRALISYVAETQTASPPNVSVGIGLAVGMFIVSLSQAFFNAHSFGFMNSITVQVIPRLCS
jgi:hypothetical protein